MIRGHAREGRPWKTVEDVELATLSWVHWHNHDRLHGYLADVPPSVPLGQLEGEPDTSAAVTLDDTDLV